MVRVKGLFPRSNSLGVQLGLAFAGIIVQLISPAQGQKALHPAGFLASILGAMLLIFLAKTFHVLL